MRVAQRQTSEHTAIVRALADRTIEAREPGLIKLPLPLPSIPVLTPLLSPIVSGNNNNGNGNDNGNNGNHNGNPGTTTTTDSAPPSSTPPSGGDTGGASGGTSSGGTGGGSTSGSGTGTGAGDSGSGSSTSGGTTSSGDGSTSGGTTSSGGGSSGDSPPPGSTPSGTTSASGTQTSGGSGGTVLTGTNNDGTNPSNSSAPGNGGTSTSSTSQGNGGIGGVANVGQSPSTGTGITKSASSSLMGASGLPGSANPGNGNGNSGSGGGALTNGQKHGLSGGATAGIIICLLALIFVIVVFCVRRRSRSRRNERVNRWWFSRNRNSQVYGDRNSREIIPTGVQTARSSFATTVDHTYYSNNSGPPSARDSHFIIPPLPPMAQIGRANGAAPAMVIDTSYFNSTNANDLTGARFSIGSANSDSQYLVVNHRDSTNQDLGTPMSVRPFSPSESFAFPKPPDPQTSRPSSSATLAMQSPTKTGALPSSTIMPPPLPPPGLVPTLVFDNSPINNVTDPFQDNNPFDDPSAATPTNIAPVVGFAETEFICRPFHPTLPDELSVRPQDPVRVLRTFDDGWALVEKVRLDDPKGKRRENDGIERGLIPLDCLRAPGQELPDFFAAKRVSSYTGSVGTGSGVGFQVL